MVLFITITGKTMNTFNPPKVVFVLSTFLLLAPLCFGAAPAMPADPHDFSGIWMNDNTLDETLKRLGKKRLAPGESLERSDARISPAMLTDEYRAIYTRQRDEKAKLAEGAAACEWPGLANLLTYPYPFEMLHTNGRITMIYETDSQVRRIFLDRTEHLPFEELDPSYNGDSIGHWEGNVLVIDTTGLHAHIPLWGNLPHSENLHVVERIAYVDANTIHDDVVVTDRLALKEPVTRTIVYSKRPDWRIREYSCLENNRDQPDAEGNRSAGVVK